MAKNTSGNLYLSPTLLLALKPTGLLIVEDDTPPIQATPTPTAYTEYCRDLIFGMDAPLDHIL